MISKITEIEAKSIFTKSGLPGSDWVINPYNGCQFACMYCYAAQIARWKHPDEEWGSFLDVKINAPEILKKELSRLQCRDVLQNVSTSSKNFGSIFFSSVTDPYTSLEAKYKITRQCLQVLADFGYEGKISIQTKSPLVTRDIDLLKQLKNVEVGFTVTTLDDKVSRFLEVMAPPVSARIDALKKLNVSGIRTYAFIGPILPHFIKSESEINNLLDKLEAVGVREVWFEHINLSFKIRERLFDYLNTVAPELLPDFQQADTMEYRQKLDALIHNCLKNRNLKLGLNKIIYHHDLPRK